MDDIKEWTSLPMPELLTRASCRKRLEEDLCWIVPHVPPMTQTVKGLNRTQLNWNVWEFLSMPVKQSCPLTLLRPKNKNKKISFVDRHTNTVHKTV